MIEAVMIWNEPNNKSHWDFEFDPEWRIFADMVAPRRMRSQEQTEVTAGSGWNLHRFIRNSSGGEARRARSLRRGRGARISARTGTIGRSTNGRTKSETSEASPICRSGFPKLESPASARKKSRNLACAERRNCSSAVCPESIGTAFTICLARGRRPRAIERPKDHHTTATFTWVCCARTVPPNALRNYSQSRSHLGICQWFNFEDHRLDDAVRWLRRLGVKHLRTGISWADSFRPNAEQWFDRQMNALKEFEVTLTFCFTPEHRGIAPHYASPPLVPGEFAEFCARITRRYARSVSDGNSSDLNESHGGVSATAMTYVLLIRHATHHVVGKKTLGHTPGVHLNVLGRQQSEQLAETLCVLPIEAVYSGHSSGRAKPQNRWRTSSIYLCTWWMNLTNWKWATGRTAPSASST